MDRLLAMQMFVRVVETGSFSKAAIEFATTQPSLASLSAFSSQSPVCSRHWERAVVASGFESPETPAPRNSSGVGWREAMTRVSTLRSTNWSTGHAQLSPIN